MNILKGVNMENKRESIQKGRRAIEYLLSAIMIFVVGYFVYSGFSHMEKVGKSELYEETNLYATEPPTEDPNKVIFMTIDIPSTVVFQGYQILVNNNNQFFSKAADLNLVGINATNKELNRKSFAAEVQAEGIKIDETVYYALAAMLDDYYAQTNKALTISSGYRTYEKQKSLYDEDLKKTGNNESSLVAKPGYSEHETGLAIDIKELTHEGDYTWLYENAWKYGFILRYPEGKTDITGIRPEPWHFRYVGVPHAYYINKFDITLEEYMDVLKRHTYDDDHLIYADENGTKYEIYYVPFAKTGIEVPIDPTDATSDNESPEQEQGELAFVFVPEQYRYEISGNNIDGFIVTVFLDKKY